MAILVHITDQLRKDARRMGISEEKLDAFARGIEDRRRLARSISSHTSS